MSKKLTLREYTTGFILLTFVFGAVYQFSGAMFQQYDTGLQGDREEIKELNKDIESASPDVGTGSEKANNINTEESGSFFLGSVLTVVETVTSGLGSLPQLGQTFIQNLGFSEIIVVLFSIPVAAVIWEVVSLYRGIRT